ncbi:MAG: ComEC/Rec2 family competence protein [Spirochaetes bacterium]|nr:ComEC/Rec2 family competence protein [Spirochaetota bacterium]
MEYRFRSQEKSVISENQIKFFSISLVLLLICICSLSYAYFHFLHLKSDLIIFSAAFILFCISIFIKYEISPCFFSSFRYRAALVFLFTAAAALPYFSVMKTCSGTYNPSAESLKITQILYLRNSSMITCTDEESGMKAFSFCPESLQIEKNAVISGNFNFRKIEAAGMYPEYLIKKGITYSFTFNKDIIITPPEKTALQTALRMKLNALIDAKTGKENGKYLKALIFGNKNFLDKKLLYYSKRCGVLHVFAASGLHVGVIIFLPMFLLRFASKKARYAAAVFPALLYLYTAGFPVSLMRASIMFFAAAYAVIRNRSENGFNCLFMAALIILALFPNELYSLGFQLSFSATMSIMLFYRKICSLFKSLPFKLSESLSLSFSVQFLVLPVMYFTLHEVNLNSIPANIIFIPFISFIFIAGLTCLAVPESFFFYHYIRKIYDVLCSLVPAVAGKLSILPFYFTGRETGWFLLLPPLLLLIVFLKLKKPKTYMFTAAYVTFILIFMFKFSKSGETGIDIRGSEMTLNRSLHNTMEFEKITDYYNSSHIESVVVYLDTNDTGNTETVNRLISTINIDKIIIDENIKYAQSTYFLFNKIESEKINFDVIKIDKTSEN